MKRRQMVIFCGTALLIAAAVVVALRERHPVPLPDVPMAQTLGEVRVKAVERKAELVERGESAAASAAVAIVCGMDKATADRYEARNDALRSIARRRDLAKGDVDALLAYLRSQDDSMRVERVAALKNGVMNLLRNQDPPVEGLAETLVEMFEGNNIGRNNFNSSGATAPDSENAAKFRGAKNKVVFTSCSSCFPFQHPPVVLDYCIQHLGAIVNGLDDAVRSDVRGVFVRAAGDRTKPYAGTALYSLAEDNRATTAELAELRRLTVALCQPEANNVARIAAIQLAGERGYVDSLPAIREVLSGQRRDAVLDIACIGSLGLLGDSTDLESLPHFAKCGGARYAAAVEAAIKRIKERADAEHVFGQD